VVAFACAVTITLALAFAAVPAKAAVPVDTVDSRIAGAEMAESPAAIVESWSADEMRNAVPPEPPVTPEASFDVPQPGATVSVPGGDFIPQNVTAYPQRVHGKIFYKVGGTEYVCSGTVIESRGRNVVLTAGHCVYDHEANTGAGDYANEMIFVPAYEEDGVQPPDEQPYGIWPATAVFTSSVFVNDKERLSHDIGAVVLADPIESEVGARGIAFDLDPNGRSFQIYGYPTAPVPQFDGNRMRGCDVQVVDRDDSAGTPAPIAAGPCSMGSGSSGGGWVTAGGYVNSVVSYGYCGSVPELCGFTFGPYFSNQAKALYTYPAVGGSVKPTVRFVSGPGKRVKARSVKFRVRGSGSTPLSYRCKLDRQRSVNCGPSIRVTRLSRGKHVLKVVARDQTNKQSRTIARTFRVVR
jgi:hypothetical protein